MGSSVPLGRGPWGPSKAAAACSSHSGAFGHSTPFAWNVFTFFLLHLPAYLHLAEHLFFPDCVHGVIVLADVLLSLPDEGPSVLSLLASLPLWVCVIVNFTHKSTCLPQVDTRQQDPNPGQVFVMAQPDTMQMLNKSVAEKVERGLWRTPP